MPCFAQFACIENLIFSFLIAIVDLIKLRLSQGVETSELEP